MPGYGYCSQVIGCLFRGKWRCGIQRCLHAPGGVPCSEGQDNEGLSMVWDIACGTTRGRYPLLSIHYSPGTSPVLFRSYGARTRTKGAGGSQGVTPLKQ